MIEKDDIVQGLRRIGLKEGDVVIVHSSLSSFGEVRGGAETVIDALVETVGASGVVATPSFGIIGTYDPETSPTSHGAICEALRHRPGVVRSLSPSAAILALGAGAEDICAGHEATLTAHAEGSPYWKIAERGGYVLLVGVDQDRNTTLHAAEEVVRSPYLTTHTAAMIVKGKTREVTYELFPGPHRDFIGIDRELRRRGVVKIGRIGASVVRLMRAKDLIETTVDMLRRDPTAVLCDNPACAACVRQRAAIWRQQIEQESFTLSVRSQMAGRYPAEISERLQLCGLRHVEIDLVVGRSLGRLRDRHFSRLVTDLHEAGIEVSSVRLRAVPSSLDRVIERCDALKAPIVVVPASARGEVIEAIGNAGLTPALENVAMGKEEFGARLTAAHAAGVRAAFNPAEFARVGENPFLTGYKRPVRKFVGLLYVCDGLFDGRPTPLARGNAEIKELVSILRCASFAGPMVLCGEPDSLEVKNAEFRDLLNGL